MRQAESGNGVRTALLRGRSSASIQLDTMVAGSNNPSGLTDDSIRKTTCRADGLDGRAVRSAAPARAAVARAARAGRGGIVRCAAVAAIDCQPAPEAAGGPAMDPLAAAGDQSP